MTQIILNDEQAKTIQEAKETVELRDRQGKILGYMTRPLGDEEIAAAKRRSNSDGPWFSTREVLEHLESLEQG